MFVISWLLIVDYPPRLSLLAVWRAQPPPSLLAKTMCPLWFASAFSVLDVQDSHHQIGPYGGRMRPTMEWGGGGHLTLYSENCFAGRCNHCWTAIRSISGASHSKFSPSAWSACVHEAWTVKRNVAISYTLCCTRTPFKSSYKQLNLRRAHHYTTLSYLWRLSSAGESSGLKNPKNGPFFFPAPWRCNFQCRVWYLPAFVR